MNSNNTRLDGNANRSYGCMTLRRSSPWAGVVLVALCILRAPPRLSACSIFALVNGSNVVYGQNLDWNESFPGHVVVNTRGVAKSVLPWKGYWPAPGDYDPVTWTARYGSVTFTCYGRDFIEGGMNEAGLMVDETNLTSRYEEEDGRPGVSCAQWMQYLLDNFGTVEEVLAHLDDLRLDGEGWHFLVADKAGSCAVIEYLTDGPLIYTGDGMPVCALSNTTYRQALSHIPMDVAFGGEINIAAGDDAYGRFITMAIWLRDYDPVRDGGASEYAFRMLDAVSSGATLRSVVYDAGHSRVLWRTPGNTRLRWLDLTTLDFSEHAPIRVISVEDGGPGDVAALLREYSEEDNRALVDAVKRPTEDSSEADRELKLRGLTVDEALELIARHPSRPVPAARSSTK